MPSLPEPPDDQSGIDEWLLAVEAAVAVGVAESMRRAIMRPVEDYVESVTLGIADPAILDAVPIRIAAVIRDDLLPSVDEVYRVAAANAWNWAPTTRTLDRGAADDFARLVNDFAEQWQSQASNRLVGSTYDIWLKVQTGAGREALKEEIERLTGFSEFRADTIARTEMASAYNNGHFEANIALGEYGPVYKEWLAGGPPRDREWHTALDGVVLPYGDDYDVDGEPMRGPHAPGASPGNVINCKCTILDYYVGDTLPDGTLVTAEGVEMGAADA
jgi:hypothetical protein